QPVVVEYQCRHRGVERAHARFKISGHAVGGVMIAQAYPRPVADQAARLIATEADTSARQGAAPAGQPWQESIGERQQVAAWRWKAAPPWGAARYQPQGLQVRV